MIRLNLQMFAFNPDTTTIQTSKTGSIPKGQVKEIVQEIVQESAMMKLAKPIEMEKEIQGFEYMTGVGAYWVNETERIQTSKPSWVTAEMRAHKLAVIIPTSAENLKYSVTDFFERVKPMIVEAFMKKFDQATFFGVNSPYTHNVFKSATDSGNIVVETGQTYDDLNNLVAKLEDKDLEPNALATVRSNKHIFRGAKDTTGNPILVDARNGLGVDSLFGIPVAYPKADTFDKTKAVIIGGDWNHVYYGIPAGIEYKILEESTLTTVKDEDGNDINLAERDMVAIRATMSIGFMVMKDEAVAVLTPKAKTTTK
jgi:HK97 family phage major capsid protein